MKKLSIVISLPGENNYLREQEAAAKITAQRLGLDLRIINAKSDPVTQSQQLLEIVQAICRFRRQPVQLTRELMAEASASFICEF